MADNRGLTDLTGWQRRAREAGLSQKRIAQMLGLSEMTVSHQLRGQYGDTSRSVVSTILAWEMLTVEQREEWIAQLQGKKAQYPGRSGLSAVALQLRDQISEVRQQQGLSRQQVATAVGLTRRQVELFEKGGDVPLGVAIRIGEALGLTLSFVQTAEAQRLVLSPRASAVEEFVDLPEEIPDQVRPGEDEM